MTTADGQGQIAFTEWIEECTAGRRSKRACRCSECAAPIASRASSGRNRRTVGPRRTARLRYGIGLLVAVVTGAGMIGLYTGVASAEPAPSHSGWDGSVYWFRNSVGDWRWTSHEDIYLNRIGSGGGSTATGASSAGGIEQGWDGSVYWFRNSVGDWRWTSHEDIYLNRIGSGGGSTATGASSAGGIEQGWDGSVYWFRNSVGDWRWTSHEDIYLNRIGSGGGSTATGASSNDDPVASSGATGDTEAAVEFALAQLGKPFVTAGNGPDGYDCSGLVQQAYRRAGISLPRVANDQFSATTPISADQLQRGDLLFWSDSDSADGIHHVAVYLGDNRYVEAAHPGTNVRISTLSSSYYPTHMGRP